MSYTPRDRFILFATVGYTLLGLAWIFLSDQLLAVFTDIKSIVWLSIAKGMFFVIATSAIFFIALRSVPSAAGSIDRVTLLGSLTTGITQRQRLRWPMYVYAVVITLVMLFVHERINNSFGHQPLLILFMLPIILSALLGGFGTGFVATVVSALGTNFQLITPTHSFFIAGSEDLLQWCFLIVNGLAVSVLSEGLRRSLSEAEYSRCLLNTVVSGTSDAIFVKDKLGRYMLANQAVANITGKSVEAIIGHDDALLFPESSAEAVMANDRIIMSSARTTTLEEHLVTPDGKQLNFLVTKGPVFDEAGRISGLFGIARDITERKQMEEALQQLNQELEDRVKMRTEELATLNQSLETFVYSVSHDLKTPLRGIEGYSRLLQKDYGEIVGGEGKLFLQNIRTGIKRMNDLIEDLLAYSRMSRQELDDEPVNINLLLENIVQERKEDFDAHGVQMDFNVPPLTVDADTEGLALVLRNLLQNALKFSQNNPEPHIEIGAKQDENTVTLWIKDNGIGFDMKYIDRIFEIFQRLHRLEDFPGTGIGLALVKMAMQRMGGNVWAESTLGQGATFFISLKKYS